MKSLTFYLIGAFVLALTSFGWAAYTDLTSPGGTTFSSGSWNGYTPDKAFDNITADLASEWESLDLVTTAAQYIGYDFGSGTVINWYRFLTGNDYGWTPSTWEFQGSNSSDFSTRTVLHTISGASFNRATWTDYYTFFNLTAYRYYRIYITAVNVDPQDDYVSINEIEIGYDASLPVTLSFFSARQQGASVVLEWGTESEVDLLGFVLDRHSADEDEWTTVADYMTDVSLAGQGNSSQGREYAVIDKDVGVGSYLYRLSEISINGEVEEVSRLEFNVNEIPGLTQLKPAVPNPFNPRTRIFYELAKDTRVDLKVYDINGRMVKTLLADKNQSAGAYNLYWNGNDEKGALVSSGTYIVVLDAGKERKTQKVLMLR